MALSMSPFTKITSAPFCQPPRRILIAQQHATSLQSKQLDKSTSSFCSRRLRISISPPSYSHRSHAALSVRSKAGTKQASDLAVEKGSVSVVLLSGGVGKRMGAGMPKQYLPLTGQPIALYSFLTFASMDEVGEIIVVCDPSYRDLFSSAHAHALSASSEDVAPELRFALPGKERQDSVFNGLQEISPSALLVAVHDSARPLVTSGETRKVLADASLHGAAVLGVKSKATIKEADSEGFVARTLDRRFLWEMQTPQVMKPQLLRDGFELVKAQGLEVTDDVSIVEHLGHPVRITEGFYTNIKVTTPDDLLVAEKLLAELRGSMIGSIVA